MYGSQDATVFSSGTREERVTKRCGRKWGGGRTGIETLLKADAQRQINCREDPRKKKKGGEAAAKGREQEKKHADWQAFEGAGSTVGMTVGEERRCKAGSSQ